MDVTGDRRKVQCCKEQYCIGIWNVRTMNQDKLEVVKQEMARVNVDFLGIRELKWTVMGEFNSDDNYIYYCGQESLRRNGVAIMVNKRIRNAVLGCSLKNDRMISVFSKGVNLSPRMHQQYILKCRGFHRVPTECWQEPLITRKLCISSVQFSCSIVSNSLQAHETQHTRPPCP